MNNVPHYERDEISYAEIYEALVTGCHPVFFQENEDDFIWGLGTLFLVQWGEYQFAITAKHVIENLKANYKHLRIFIPGYQVALPIIGASIPSFPRHEEKQCMEDLFIFHIEKDPDLDGNELTWYAWRMEDFWSPSSKLEEGQQIFAVGYPSTDNRFDYDNQKISTPPLVAVGKLSSNSIGKDIYTIDCEEFECDLNGISGGPVFARFNGLFHYVGMIVRAGSTARKIHFIDSSHITFAIKEVARKL